MEFLEGLIALALLAGVLLVLVKARRSASPARLGIGRRGNGDDPHVPIKPTEQ